MRPSPSRPPQFRTHSGKAAEAWRPETPRSLAGRVSLTASDLPSIAADNMKTSYAGETPGTRPSISALLSATSNTMYLGHPLLYFSPQPSSRLIAGKSLHGHAYDHRRRMACCPSLGFFIAHK